MDVAGVTKSNRIMAKPFRWLGLALFAGLLLTSSVSAQVVPKISVEVGKATQPGDLSVTLQIVILMTVLALAPSILIMTTAFIRIAVVLSFLRQAIGTNQTPPNQLIVGLALILTFFIMTPVFNQSYQDGLKP